MTIPNDVVVNRVEAAQGKVMEAMSEIFALLGAATSPDTPDGYLVAEIGPIYGKLSKLHKELGNLL